MERVYFTVKIDHAKGVLTLLEWPQIEALVIWAVKKELLTLRIDYRSRLISQRPSKADAAASSELRCSLSRFAGSLDAVAWKLKEAATAARTDELRAELKRKIADGGLDEEHAKILSRRSTIERRKEEAERVAMEEEKERARLKALKQREEETEEKARLAAEAQRRDAERAERERAEEEAAAMRKLAEQMAEQRKNMKVAKKRGEAAKVETDVEKLANKDRNELMQEQRALMADERSEFEKRLESMSKRHDHLERARRDEERELLLAAFEAKQSADKLAHEERAANLARAMKETRAHDLEEKKRFGRMGAAVEAFKERVIDERRKDHIGVLIKWREDKARRDEERKAERARQVGRLPTPLHPDADSSTPSPPALTLASPSLLHVAARGGEGARGDAGAGAARGGEGGGDAHPGGGGGGAQEEGGGGGAQARGGAAARAREGARGEAEAAGDRPAGDDALITR